MGSPELLVVFWAHSRLPAATNPHRETAGRRSEQMGNLIQKEEDNDEEQPAMQQGKSDPAGTRPTASKPWVELNDPGNVMMTLGRRRIEWSVRMGVIYCVTMLYAVSEHVSNSRVFGTWPILANFYGTFAIASSVGGAVTGCVEMARGCTIGTLLAVATVEITLKADADLDNLAQSTLVISGILGALFVAVTITPILTKSEKQMLLSVWKSTSVSGAPDNSSLSHFSAMTRSC